jgi:hypothetical protein
MGTNICALRGIQTHGLNIHVIKAYVLDSVATGNSTFMSVTFQYGEFLINTMKKLFYAFV